MRTREECIRCDTGIVTRDVISATHGCVYYATYNGNHPGGKLGDFPTKQLTIPPHPAARNEPRRPSCHPYLPINAVSSQVFLTSSLSLGRSPSRSSTKAASAASRICP